MKILFKYPTYKRPEWFMQTLSTYYKMLSGKHEYQFSLSLNIDDDTMNNRPIIEWMDKCPLLSYRFGDHKNKIAAVNADMIGLDFDILFLISDDMIPIVQGFDDVIVKAMQEHFPDMDGALHYNDGCCGQDRTITLSIMGKKLYDRFGYIYHPDYASFYCDNEFTDEVRRMEKVIYIPEVIVKHDWKGFDKNRDNVYKRNSRLGKGDGDVYNRRKAAGFPK